MSVTHDIWNKYVTKNTKGEKTQYFMYLNYIEEK